MEKNAPPPAPKPDPLNFCRTCGKPIDILAPAWIPIGAGVAAGVDCRDCR